MKLNGVRRRWQVSAAVVAGIAAVGLLLSGHRIAANEDAKDEVALGADITDQVKVEVSERLRYSGRSSYRVELQVTNESEKPLKGPVLLVIEGTGIEGLEFALPDGTLESGEQYLVILRQGQELAPDQATPQRAYLLEAPERLTYGEASRFELEYRLVRAQFRKQPASDREAEETVIRQAGPPAVPGHAASGRNSAISRQSEPEQEKLEPIPEPAPQRQPREDEPRFPEAEVNRIIEVQDRWTERLFAIEGVHSTATGFDKKGNLGVVVHIERHGIRHELPKEVDGVPVIWKVTGPMREWAGPPPRLGQAGGHQVRESDPPRPDPSDCQDSPDFPWPFSIPIGVSVSVEGVPGVGTLGCGLRDENGVQYVLSNRHVLRPPGVPIGTRIHQPGVPLFTEFAIGRVAAFVVANTNGPNEVDAAVARPEVFEGLFRPAPADGQSLISTNPPCYGNDWFYTYSAPRRRTRQAVLGMPVMKVGRTTLFTSGTVTEVNTTSQVSGALGNLQYIKQFSVEADEETLTGRFPPPVPRDFGAPGDSGSLVVARFDSSPVGLLFAGGGGITLCNHIDKVLEELARELRVQSLTVDGFEGNPQNR